MSGCTNILIKINLCTATGEIIQVFRTGMLNANAGPDFLDAQVKIGEEMWNGSIEVHLKASDWLRHQHEQDTRYDQVILHVVWENDRNLQRTDGSAIATVELNARVKPSLLQAYQNLKKEKETIPCGPFIKQVPDLPKLQMLDRVLLERLAQKAERIITLLERNNQDWEAVAYQSLAASFGFKINQEAFFRLSTILPYQIIRKNQHQLFRLEALLFGQAGFLTQVPANDEYLNQLRKEYFFLHHKYALEPPLKTADWNFLRLRPANFPTVRLAQLAAFLHQKEYLFSKMISLPTPVHYFNFLSGTVSGYWQQHYMPGRESKSLSSGMGQASKEIILINTVVPLLFAYGRRQDNQQFIDKAIGLLEQLKAENNSITRVYTDLNLKNKSAADSQAYIELNQHYCVPRQCLYCSIGHYILKANLAQ